MMDWLAGGRHRLPVLLAVYFAAHVVVRTALSTSLDFDESEQVVLSQFLSLGYNSQPPLYTWIQRGLFEVLGYSVFSLALLKNLFIWMTYWFVFEAIRKATDNLRLAAVATLGMLTIPQIAWESHRDLSHTVAATFATTLLCYAVISLAKNTRPKHSLLWYALIGISVGLGALFKYNFAIVVIGFVMAAVSIPKYRPLLLDRRILVSLAIASVMVLPHVTWMLQHPDLVSTKTVTTLTMGQSDSWTTNVASGLSAIGISLVTCCLMTLCIFFGLFVRRQHRAADGMYTDCTTTRLLVERFLLTVLAVLLIIVLSGHAVEFKNRWFQPFICLLPAYLALAYAPSILVRPRAMNLSAWMTLGLMLFILIAVVGRPMTGRYRGKYSWLNIPYGDVSDVIREQTVADPNFIVAANARIAGNMKVQYPDSIVISRDVRHLAAGIATSTQVKPISVLALADNQSVETIDELTAFTESTFEGRVIRQSQSLTVDVGYVYGAKGDSRRFIYSELQLQPTAPVDAKIAMRPDSDGHRDE